MTTVGVSTVKEVLENLRQEIVATLQSRKIRPPQDALVAGGAEAAVAAWVRHQKRSVAAVPRRVHEAPELLARPLDAGTRDALATIKTEFQRGDDMTQRLTRHFYKAGFNDFLFNTFGVHHLHLGEPGQATDSTKQHAMAGGADDLLFVIVRDKDAYFLDVLDHDTFDDAGMTKSLVQIAQKNWPKLLEQYVLRVESTDLSFDNAFQMAKKGFTVPFEVDGVVFAAGNVLDGKVRKLKGPNGEDAGYERSACTSADVIATTHHMLNAVVGLVKSLAGDAEALADQVEKRTGERPLDFRLEVVALGNLVILRDKATRVEFASDGRSSAYQFMFPPTVG